MKKQNTPTPEATPVKREGEFEKWLDNEIRLAKEWSIGSHSPNDYPKTWLAALMHVKVNAPVSTPTPLKESIEGKAEDWNKLQQSWKELYKQIIDLPPQTFVLNENGDKESAESYWYIKMSEPLTKVDFEQANDILQKTNEWYESNR